MNSILQAIETWLKDLLVSGIMNNLSNTFDSVNSQVAQIATDVGQTPANYAPGVFALIRNLSETVIILIGRMFIIILFSILPILHVIESFVIPGSSHWLYRNLVI